MQEKQYEYDLKFLWENAFGNDIMQNVHPFYKLM